MRRKISRRSVLGKRVPQRTCVACRVVKDKRELVRLVRVPDGDVEVDDEGKIAGRGAYLCRVEECWRIGLKGGRLEYALRARLTHDNRERLLDVAKALEKADSRLERS